MVKDLLDIEWDFINAPEDPFSKIHPYPAKFIREIPLALIDKLEPLKDKVILDPFCGSGSTLSAAQERGYKSIGVDLNPIACLISKIRTCTIDSGLLGVVDDVISACFKSSQGTAIPHIKNIDHWFSMEIQQTLSRLKSEIDQLKNTVFYDPLCFCFSSIIVKVSNQDSDTRYAFRDKGKRKEDVFNYFRNSAKKLLASKMPYNCVSSKVINKNSLELNNDDIPDNIGLVITSPPYPNAYEYWLYHKFRMYWLGYDPQKVKENEIGTRSLFYKSKKPANYEFVQQMNSLLTFLYNRCVDGAYLCFVLGRSKIYGKIVDNDKIISKIAQNIGYKYDLTIEREMNVRKKSFNLTNSRIQKEYIVIFHK